MNSQTKASASAPRRHLTRAELYQLAVYWTGEQRKSAMATERLAAIQAVLGADALLDVATDVALNEEFGEDDGYRLEEPTIALPEEICTAFKATREELRVLEGLYARLITHYLEQVEVVREASARLPSAEMVTR